MALDDFGTGYSSLTYLTNFPFDKIKIDRTFTHDVLNRRDCAAVVSSVLALAQGLGTITTVEGIETEEQFEYMRQRRRRPRAGLSVQPAGPVVRTRFDQCSPADALVAKLSWRHFKQFLSRSWRRSRNSQEDMIDQLEYILASRDLSRRAGILRKVTDLFVLESGTFSEDQIELFDNVMGKLLENIEQRRPRAIRQPHRRTARRAARRSSASSHRMPRSRWPDPFSRHCERLDVRTPWSRTPEPRARTICWRSPAARSWSRR